jgi:hypothetical protein
MPVKKHSPMNMLLPPNVDTSGLEAQRLAVDTSLAGLEAQRLAAFDRYRAPAMPTSMVYYEMLRRQQVIRDTMMYQQMGDPIAFNSAFEMPILAVSWPSQPPLPNQGLSYHLQLCARGSHQIA